MAGGGGISGLHCSGGNHRIHLNDWQRHLEAHGRRICVTSRELFPFLPPDENISAPRWQATLEQPPPVEFASIRPDQSSSGTSNKAR
jgi:hypothetical protein